jgi:tetratricopeptide (TPR) repeat protein
VTNYDRAIQQYTRLLANYPTNLEWQFELTRTWNDLGISYARQADYTNANAALNHALLLRENLIQIRPTNTWWLGAYGVTACNLGQVCRHLKRLDEAGANLQKAEIVFRQWVVADPSSSLAKRRLATALGAAGHLASDRGKVVEAKRAYTENLQLAREALRDDPKSGDALSDVMLALNFVGEAQTAQSNYVAAAATLAESVQIGGQLMARDAANHEWQMYLTTILDDQGNAFRGAQRPQEALASFKRAWELCDAQAADVQQSPHWLATQRDALEQGEQLERELASEAAAAGQADEAGRHKLASYKLQIKIQSLPRNKSGGTD